MRLENHCCLTLISPMSMIQIPTHLIWLCLCLCVHEPCAYINVKAYSDAKTLLELNIMAFTKKRAHLLELP